MILKWAWRIVLLALWLATGPLGLKLPSTSMNWLVDLEVRLTNNVPDPILFAFLTGLLISTWIIPEIWSRLKLGFNFDRRDKPVALSLPLMDVTQIALHILIDSSWAWKKRLNVDLWEDVKEAVPWEMTIAAKNGNVRYIGARQIDGTPQSQEIDRAYWHGSEHFDGDSIWDSENTNFTTSFGTDAFEGGTSVRYEHGAAPKIDVSQTWPKASIFLKVYVKFVVFIRRIQEGIADDEWPTRD